MIESAARDLHGLDRAAENSAPQLDSCKRGRGINDGFFRYTSDSVTARPYRG